MKKLSATFIFCCFLAACQSRNASLSIVSATAQAPPGTLAAALNSVEVSCDVKLSKEIFKGEWELRFAFFRKGKLIITGDALDYPCDHRMFGGALGGKMLVRENGKPRLITDRREKFSNFTINLFFINLEYIDLNERIENKKCYKVYLYAGAIGSKSRCISEMFLPKSVMNLSSYDIGTFPDGFKHPVNIIPIFYIRETNFWEDWESTEKSLPPPRKNLRSFIKAEYPDTVMVCILVKNIKSYLDFLDTFVRASPR